MIEIETNNRFLGFIKREEEKENGKTRKQKYQEYLKTRHWKFKRKQYYKNHSKKCFCCGDLAENLHHINYKRLGKEKNKDLIQLCRSCHQAIHKMKKEENIKLSEAHIILKERIKIAKKILKLNNRWVV